MCNRLFVVLLVLGLVASAHAGLGDMLIHYTFDAADDLGGTNVSNLTGTMGFLHMGAISSNSSDGYQYDNTALIGDGMVLTNEGPVPPADPGVVNAERCDVVDIEAGTEGDPMMAPFDNKTISIWFRQDVSIIPDNHIGQWTGDRNYIFGTTAWYQSHILLERDQWSPDTAPNVLKVRAGGRDNNAVKHYSGNMAMIPITLGEWYHVVLTLENICGATDFDNALARTFVNGVQVGAGVMIRNSDAFRFGSYRDKLNGAAVGAYTFDDQVTFYEAADGITVDDLAIYSGALTTAQVALLYSNGLQGIAAESFDTPEPATIALLGMGALALLRKRS